MSKHYAIFKLQKLNRKERRELQMRSKHVNRETNSSNVDPEKGSLNRCLVGRENSDWYALFQERFNNLPYYKLPEAKKLRKDAVIGVEVITSMSHEAAEHVNIEEWCEANIEWMQKHFGEENVLHGVLHMDEGTPHIHFFITPVISGRFNAREFLGGKLDFVRRQTEYAKAMEPFGLSRGSEGARLKYTTVQQLYDITTDEIADLPPTREGESVAEYRARVNDIYIGAQLLERKMHNQVTVLKAIKERNEEYQEKINSLHEELRALEKMLENEKKKKENLTIRGLKVNDIVAAIEKHPDQEAISMYLHDLAHLADVGAIILAEENQERTHD